MDKSEKYDILFILNLKEGAEVVLVRNITIPLKDKIAQVKEAAGFVKVHWTAFSHDKKVIDSGTINGTDEDDEEIKE